MLECVMNLSEGRRLELVAELAGLAEFDLLDIHADPHHHRSVVTLVGTSAPRVITQHAIRLVDLRTHQGVHPRLGVVDVVPFVPLHGSTMTDAIEARNDFAHWAADELGVPCFLYGPERSLPDVRRRAWKELTPDVGPQHAHPTAGAICVGARDVLVAYNVWLATGELSTARRIASAVRGPSIRALGLQVGDRYQISMNLVEPDHLGPASAYDLVAAASAREGLDLAGAELVGLIPARCLAEIPRSRWSELDLAPERTIEWQLAQRHRRSDRRS